MIQVKTKVIANKKIAEDHYVLAFRTKNIKVKPGQFFNVRINDSYEPFLRRPFGAHKIEKGRIEILYKVVGKATQILSTKQKGDIVDIIGPIGNGFNHISQPGREIGILVAGGHGVAPLYALAKKLITYLPAGRHGNLKLTTFIGARTKKHVVCDKDFRKLGAKVYVATDDGTKGYKGLVTELLKKKIPDTGCRQTGKPANRQTIYACGPKPMLKEVAKIAKRYRIPCQVSLEEYIACGIGTCFGCAVKTKSGYKMVCKDGPVFDAKEIIWQA